MNDYQDSKIAEIKIEIQRIEGDIKRNTTAVHKDTEKVEQMKAMILKLEKKGL